MDEHDLISINILLQGKYVLLTGNYKKAILLEYFIMCQEKDNEWFGVSFSKISEESLLGLSIVAIKKYVRELIEKGWISSRSNLNPSFGTARYQYKVNFDKIEKDLENIRR